MGLNACTTRLDLQKELLYFFHFLYLCVGQESFSTVQFSDTELRSSIRLGDRHNLLRDLLRHRLCNQNIWSEEKKVESRLDSFIHVVVIDHKELYCVIYCVPCKVELKYRSYLITI